MKTEQLSFLADPEPSPPGPDSDPFPQKKKASPAKSSQPRRAKRDNQDIHYWREAHKMRMEDFQNQVAPALGLQMIRSQGQVVINGRDCRVHIQGTRFNRAFEMYGIQPQFAFSMNIDNYQRILATCPGCLIYVWFPPYGVYRTEFRNLRQQVEAGGMKENKYKERENLPPENPNSRDSYIFNLETFEYLGGMGLIPRPLPPPEEVKKRSKTCIT